MTDTISQDKLIELDFPEKLLSSPKTCKNLLEYCINHINLLRSKTEEKVFILISSPLEDMDMIDAFKKYPYDIYVIRPDFLDYYAFIEESSRQEEKVNYAFTNAEQSQIQHVNEMIYQDTGLSDVFKKYIF